MAREPVSREEQREASTSKDSLLARRDYLRLGAATAAVVTSGAALTGVAGAATEHRGIGFDQVVDAVDDLGMDASGSEPIDGALDANLESGTLIRFPAGEFRVTNDFYVGDMSNVGILGAGSGSTTFVFDSGYNAEFFNAQGGKDVLLEGFALDTSASHNTAANLTVRVDDGLEIHDIEWLGFTPNAADFVANLVPYVETVDGVGHVSGIKMTGGGVEGTYPDRTSGIFCGNAVTGELIMRNLHIEEMGSTALSARDPRGVVKVEDSFFANNDNSSIRLGGGNHPSKVAWAKNCTVVADESRVQNLPDGEEYENCDLVRIDGGHTLEYGSIIENCTLEYRSHPPGAFSRGAIARPTFSDNGAFTVRGCTISIDAEGVPAINARDATSDIPADVTVTDTHITGSVSETNAGAAIYAEDSDGSTIENICVNLPNLDTGILIENSADCEITSSDIYTAGEATKFVDSNVATSDITNDGACRVPGDSDSTTDDSTTDDSTTDDSTTDDSTTDDSTTDGSTDDSTSDGSTDDSTTDDTEGLPNSLRISGKGTPTNYRFTVSEQLKADQQASDLESWDGISGSTADGWVTDESNVDSYAFSGSVTDFAFVEGDATVELNGEVVDPSTLGSTDGGSSDGSTDDSTSDGSTDGSTDDSTSDGSTDGSTDDTHTVSIIGTGTSTNYRFTVSGDLAAGPDANDLESWDDITESTADGWVTTESNVDTYQFTGDIVEFEFVEGDATVEVDGEVVDPSALGLDRSLSIVGYDEGTTATYEVTASGSIRPSSADSVDATSTVEGAITDGTRSYDFGGDITYFALDGDAEVYVDGRQVDPDALANGEIVPYENLLVVDGSANNGKTKYQFSVTGDIARSPDLGSAETEDVISGGAVVGSVKGDVDGYRFTGDIVTLDVNGSASVNFGSVDSEN